jgi:hypothetical protein
MTFRRRDFLAAVSSSAAWAAPSATGIDGGRQLFFDDRLVADTTLERVWHTPAIHEASPVLRPETPVETNGGVRPVACPFSDGVWYDPRDRIFKMWYQAGWFDGVAYATSEDGLRWSRPPLDVVPGANRVLVPRQGHTRDGVTVWPDYDSPDPRQRWKMFGYYRRAGQDAIGEVYTSPDGIHWDGPRLTSRCGDNTNFFYDAFRKLWVWSLRPEKSPRGRARIRREHPDFLASATWRPDELLGPVMHPDDGDRPDPAIGVPTQLYHWTAIAYESVMLGQFMIHFGPDNTICAKGGFPKTTDVNIGFSRDGVRWLRSPRRPFIGCSRQPGTWNRGYVHNTGGVCLIVGDRLYFYFGAWSGISPKKRGGDMYAGGSTGLAVLRRDGFVSMRGTGVLTTPPVTFSGRHLFVNATGEVAVEVAGQRGYGVKDCVPARSGGTCQPVRWKSRRDLAALAGKPVRFRFHVTRGDLYAFWVSPDRTGASYGFVAAGGPGFSGPRDTAGAGRDLV